MNRILFWLTHHALKRAFLSNQATLFDAEHTGDTKFALGNVIQMRDSRYRAKAIASGMSGWQAIEADSQALSATLRCRHCGHTHAIRAHRGGADAFVAALAESTFGTFDRYQGFWQSTWFRLAAPTLGERDILICQHCNTEGVPVIRLFERGLSPALVGMAKLVKFSTGVFLVLGIIIALYQSMGGLVLFIASLVVVAALIIFGIIMEKRRSTAKAREIREYNERELQRIRGGSR